MTKRVRQSRQKGGAQSDYQTPRWAIDRYLETKPAILDNAKTIIEPNAGEGRIVEALQEHGYGATVWSFEIQERYRNYLNELEAGPVMIGDCFDLIDEVPDEAGTVLITNPAFPISFDLLKAYWMLVDHIVFLHRISFLGTQTRNTWFKKHVPHVSMLPDRPSFTEDGNNDQEYYAWMHWDTSEERNENGIVLLRDRSAEKRNRKSSKATPK